MPDPLPETLPDYFSDEASTFGDRLAAARENLGLSQLDLGKQLGVTENLVAAWEDDQGEPRANKLQTLAGILNISIAWLLSGQGQGLADLETDRDSTSIVRECLEDIGILREELRKSTNRLSRLEARLRSLSD